MFRCLRPGCPTDCGTRRKPSCADRVLWYAVMSLLAAALLVSLGMGMRWLSQEARDSGRALEAAPIAVSETLELAGETEDDRRKGILGDGNGKPNLLDDSPVQVPE